jgi:large subunit ribosomal protein L2
MPVKIYKPTSPSRRGMTTQELFDITTKKPLKSLTTKKRSTGGRNNKGRITVRHRGSGVKNLYRLVNFNLPEGTSAVIEEIEYDPNRSARIARIKDSNGKYHYILAIKGKKVGDNVITGKTASITNGNRLALKDVPVGSTVNSIEFTPGKGAQIARSAGASAQLMAKENGYAQLRMPSGENRLVHENCQATIGIISNEQHQNINFGNAGRMRRKGRRPSVRGVVMNAADHPHGGGDGGSHPPGRHPRTPWGQKTLGYKTRRRKSSHKLIVRTRHQAKRR